MGIKKSTSALMMLGLGLMLSEYGSKAYDSYEDFEKNPNRKLTPIEPPIPNGMKYYCFRSDGSFKQYERDGAMLKEEVAFSCYSLNDKNAIKKFDKWKFNQLNSM
jgi:hypothetical protein